MSGDTHFVSSYMEAEVIKIYLPDLVTAISDIVQPVSDQCLAKGLIPESVYKRVLESGGTSEDKARTLILAVKTSTGTDSRCLEILLNILERELPQVVKVKLLSEIRKEIADKGNTCRAVVPLAQIVQYVPNEDQPKDGLLLQSSLLGKFEDSVRQHEHACTEKNLLEERLRVKSEEYEQIKRDLEGMKGQIQESSDKVTAVQRRIANYEGEINKLKIKISELKKTIEKQGMQTRRGRNMVTMVTEKAFTHLAQQSKQMIEQKEKKCKIAAEEKEAAVQQTVKHETKIKDLEHTIAIQKIRIRELEAKHDLSLHVDNIIRREHISHLMEYIREPFRWRDIGLTLGFSTKELDNIQQNADFQHHNNPVHTSKYDHFGKRYISEMLSEWIKWYPGDSRGSTSFATYTQLKTKLVEAGLGEIVRNLPPYDHLDNSEAESDDYMYEHSNESIGDEWSTVEPEDTY